MKILYWTGLFWPHIGGVEVLSTQFIPAMQKRGYEFAVLTSRTNSTLKKNETYNGIRIHRLAFHKGLEDNNIDEIKKIKEQIDNLKRSFKPDLVHINSVDATIFYHLLTNNKNRIPTLVTLHALPLYQINGDTILVKVLQSADWITTASEAMLKTARKIFKNKNNSSLIYYGLNKPGIQPSGLSLNPPRLLCLGRLVPEKGFDLALEALSEILIHFPKVRLIIAGDGPEKIKLKKKAEKLDISSAVEFMGWVPPEEVPGLINKSSIVVIPSRWEEPFGLAALQAAQLSRPAIAANAGGLPEIVEHERTGLLFEKSNSNDLAAKIISLLVNYDKAVQMGKNALTKSLKFGFDSYIDAYDTLYKRLISSSVKLAH